MPDQPSGHTIFLIGWNDSRSYFFQLGSRIFYGISLIRRLKKGDTLKVSARDGAVQVEPA